MRKWVLIAAMASVVAGPAQSQSMTGNMVWDVCGDDESDILGAFCSGYTVGLIEGVWFGASSLVMRLDTEPSTAAEVNSTTSLFMGYCVPENATKAQIRAVFVRYLGENPSFRHEPARVLFTRSMIQAFPCS